MKVCSIANPIFMGKGLDLDLVQMITLQRILLENKEDYDHELTPIPSS